jgi:hypothetical protein
MVSTNAMEIGRPRCAVTHSVGPLPASYRASPASRTLDRALPIETEAVCSRPGWRRWFTADERLGMSPRKARALLRLERSTSSSSRRTVTSAARSIHAVWKRSDPGTRGRGPRARETAARPARIRAAPRPLPPRRSHPRARGHLFGAAAMLRIAAPVSRRVRRATLPRWPSPGRPSPSTI